MNAGPVIHPPLMVMNAAPLQHFDRWDIHAEGTQPAVRAVTDRLDLERIAVREALGYGAPHYPLADHYANDRWMYGDAHKKLVDSGDWREHIDLHTHRYISEDTELGLAFLASVARWCGRRCADRARPARHHRRLPRPRPALRSRARSRRSASQRSTAPACSSGCTMASSGTHGTLRRVRRRPHGPRHRHRLRLRRPRDLARRLAFARRRRGGTSCAPRPSPRSGRALAILAELGVIGGARDRDDRSARRLGRRRPTRPPRSPPPRLVFEGVPETLDAKRDALGRDRPPLPRRRDRHLDDEQHPRHAARAAGASGPSASSTCTGSIRRT